MRELTYRRPTVRSIDRASARAIAALGLAAALVVSAGPARAQGAEASAAVRWDRPTPGTLQRGVFWVRRPAVLVTIAGAACAAVLGGALYQRFRRRPPRS